MTTPRHMRGPRGTGRTTRQLQHLPQGGHFFCDLRLVSYMKDKAKVIGRTDIRFHSVKKLLDPYEFCGLQRTGAAVDHSVELTPELQKGWEMIRTWVWPL